MRSSSSKRKSTTKALRDVALIAPIVASQRMQRMARMPTYSAALQCSSLVTEKLMAFADIWFQTSMIVARTQMQIASRLFSLSPPLAPAGMASIVTTAGDDIAHASATSIARRVKKNLRR